MKITRKTANYTFALLINLVLIVPFVQFLIWPHKASSQFIDGVSGLLILKVVSFSIVFDLINPAKSRRTKIADLVMAVIFAGFAYRYAGVYSIIYFVGSISVDLLAAQRFSNRQKSKWMDEAFARLCLIAGLLLPSAIISSAIQSHYFNIVASKSELFTTTKGSNIFFPSIVLFIFYYLLEPFAMPIFNLFMGDNKFSNFLWKKKITIFKDL